MSYGIQISSAIGSDDITDLTSFRVFAAETKTETVTTTGQTFTYTAPTGWTSSNGTFYVSPNSGGILPSFSVASSNTIQATFETYGATLKANSWTVFWLVKNGTDTPSGYGFLIENGSGTTVLSNDTETLLAYDTGTLTSFTTTNTGYRQFALPPSFSVDTDIIFIKLTDGADLLASSRDTYYGVDKFRVNSSTDTSLDYFTVRRSSSLPNPTGYGVAVYSSIGEVIYTTDYDIFPSNGQSFAVESSSSTTVDTTKDVWVNLTFGVPFPFCPDGGQGLFPTFNIIFGVIRSGSDVSSYPVSLIDDDPSGSSVSYPHSNTALIVQR